MWNLVKIAYNSSTENTLSLISIETHLQPLHVVCEERWGRGRESGSWITVLIASWHLEWKSTGRNLCRLKLNKEKGKSTRKDRENYSKKSTFFPSSLYPKGQVTIWAITWSYYLYLNLVHWEETRQWGRGWAAHVSMCVWESKCQWKSKRQKMRQMYDDHNGIWWKDEKREEERKMYLCSICHLNTWWLL